MHCLLSDIHISKEFQQTKCNQEKIMKAAEYIDQNHINLRLIILDENGTLIDGYATYLAAKMLNLNTVFCNRKFKGVVYGKFYYSNKVYEWSNPKNIKVKKGDILIVENRESVSLVKVEKIGYSDHLPEKNVLVNLSGNDLVNMVIVGLAEYLGIKITNEFKTIILEDDIKNEITDIFYHYDDCDKLIQMSKTQKELFKSLYFLKSLFK